eukprot:73274-Pelagomonas_calceolata.AAC.1
MYGGMYHNGHVIVALGFMRVFFAHWAPAKLEAWVLCQPSGYGVIGRKEKEKLCRQFKHSPRQLRIREYLGPRHCVSPSPRQTKERSQWGSGGLLAVARA